SLRGIVFDFDGVIANSEPLHFQGFQHVLSNVGVMLSEADYYTRYLGFDDTGAFAAISTDRDLNWTKDFVAALVVQKAMQLERLEATQSVLFPGAADTIHRLAAEGPLAIASGALRREILRILEKEHLAPYFVTVVGAEDADESKPSPAPYLKAVERLAACTGWPAPAAYVAIEDSHWGLESARAAGLRTVAVTHTYPAHTLHADLTVSNLNDLSWSQLEKLVRAV
ncbi:MAG: HAD family phosphatase, partial [Acidimicrobiia bacterium]|nr:HAD family phosphatase [Acidimicrobiia bacterium]